MSTVIISTRTSAVARSFLCLRALARLNLRDPDILRAALLDVVRDIPTTPQDGDRTISGQGQEGFV